MLGPVLTIVAVGLYAVLHSLLASLRAKELTRNMLGERSDRFYRLFFNVVGGVTLLPVLAIPALLPGRTLYSIPFPWIVLTSALQLVGLAIIAGGVLQTGALSFLGLRQLIGGEEDQGKLVVSGLYRFVRHPLYTGGLLFIWMSPAMTTSLAALYLSFSAYLYVGSIFEERRLMHEFGEAYEEYRRLVPRLLPRPWRRYT